MNKQQIKSLKYIEGKRMSIKGQKGLYLVMRSGNKTYFARVPNVKTGKGYTWQMIGQYTDVTFTNACNIAASHYALAKQGRFADGKAAPKLSVDAERSMQEAFDTFMKVEIEGRLNRQHPEKMQKNMARYLLEVFSL